MAMAAVVDAELWLASPVWRLVFPPTRTHVEKRHSSTPEEIYMMDKFELVKIARKQRDRIEELEAENAALREALSEIREIYAGSDRIPVPETAPEGYLLRLLEQMYQVTADALGGK